MKAIFCMLLCIFPVFSACVGNMLLRYKSVQSFKVIEINSKPIISLEISGLAIHSSYAVKSIETKVDNGCMVILVHLVLARKGLSGSFLYKVNVPETVNSVCFECANNLIWKRGIGPIKAAP